MRRNKYWSPYAAGALLGLTLLATFVIAGRGLGASGAFSVLSATSVKAVAPSYAERLSYFSRYFQTSSPLLDWNLFLILGVFFGALAGSVLSRNFQLAFDRSGRTTAFARFLNALGGGVLIGYAARLARGCTSGVALTGGAQLALAGWIFVVAMFAAGFLFAAVFRRYWS